MPKSIKQRSGEIIASLRHKNRITPADLEEALEKAGIDSASGKKDYIDRLEDRGYITRTRGGWKLSEESKQDGIITIRVTPSQNRDDVLGKLHLHQFGHLVTVEVES